MQGKELYDFLFKLYDYADDLADRIQPGNFDNANYFMTLVFIEKYFDRIGRGEIRAAAETCNEPDIDPKKSLAKAHERIDLLRRRISSLVDQYDFTERMNELDIQTVSEWVKPKS